LNLALLEADEAVEMRAGTDRIVHHTEVVTDSIVRHTAGESDTIVRPADDDEEGRDGASECRTDNPVQHVDPNRPVRVVVVSFLFNWPSTGGGIIHTVELIKFLTRAGYVVRHVFVRFVPWGIGIVEGPIEHDAEVLEFHESNWNMPSIQAAVRAAVERFDPDQVIITDSWNSKPLLAEAVRGYPYILRLQAMECFCPLNNVRLLPGEHGGFRQCPKHQLANPQDCANCLKRYGPCSGSLHRAERALCGVGTPEYHEKLLRAFREASAVLVVNPLMEAMISPYTERVRTVTAGMDPARFPWPRPDTEKDKWQMADVKGKEDKCQMADVKGEAKDNQGPAGDTNNRRLVLLFAGLVDEQIKGFGVLHEACRRLWQHRHDFELWATADPPGRLDDFTRFIGWQSQENLPRRLHESDILVMPTVAQEALGRTVVEAMAAGRPVVASRLGGLPFTVADGATGLLAEPGDPDDLARKIETLLDNPELRRRMGEAGRKRFEQYYAWEGIIDRHYRPLLVPRNRTIQAVV
jgi:glycosyltransferase involved in cell wall biosynthesis